MQVQFKHNMEIEGVEHDLTVHATYTPHFPGTREDPPQDEEIEINSVMMPVTGHCMEILTPDEIEMLEHAAMEQVAAIYEGYHETHL